MEDVHNPSSAVDSVCTHQQQQPHQTSNNIFITDNRTLHTHPEQQQTQQHDTQDPQGGGVNHSGTNSEISDLVNESQPSQHGYCLKKSNGKQAVMTGGKISLRAGETADGMPQVIRIQQVHYVGTVMNADQTIVVSSSNNNNNIASNNNNNDNINVNNNANNNINNNSISSSCFSNNLNDGCSNTGSSTSSNNIGLALASGDNNAAICTTNGNGHEKNLVAKVTMVPSAFDQLLMSGHGQQHQSQPQQQQQAVESSTSMSDPTDQQQNTVYFEGILDVDALGGNAKILRTGDGMIPAKIIQTKPTRVRTFQNSVLLGAESVGESGVCSANMSSIRPVCIVNKADQQHSDIVHGTAIDGTIRPGFNLQLRHDATISVKVASSTPRLDLTPLIVKPEGGLVEASCVAFESVAKSDSATASSTSKAAEIAVAEADSSKRVVSTDNNSSNSGSSCSASNTNVSNNGSHSKDLPTEAILKAARQLLLHRPIHNPIDSRATRSPDALRCAVCNKQFSTTSALTKHKLTHSNERKFVCQLCSKAFKRQDHL